MEIIPDGLDCVLKVEGGTSSRAGVERQGNQGAACVTSFHSDFGSTVSVTHTGQAQQGWLLLLGKGRWCQSWQVPLQKWPVVGQDRGRD